MVENQEGASSERGGLAFKYAPMVIQSSNILMGSQHRSVAAQVRSESLHVWTKDAQGADHLATLSDAGVGAIFLGNVSTPFDLKDGANGLLGQVASTGIYAGEDGSVGTIQQINLVA